MRFTDYAKERNVKLLYDDVKYLTKILNEIPYSRRRDILKRYILEWHRGMAMEEVIHKKQNRGRYRANKWIGVLIKIHV